MTILTKLEEEYPSLTKGDIRAALSYATSVTRGEIVPINTEC